MHQSSFVSIILILTIVNPLSLAWNAVIEIVSASSTPSFNARCTRVPPDFCCRAINASDTQSRFAGDYASFSSLPKDAVSTLHTWIGSPSLPTNLNAACDQQIVDISGKSNWSWRATAARHGDNENGNNGNAGVTSNLITGAAYFICPLGKNKGVNLMGYFRNTFAEVVKMCVGGNVFSPRRGDGMVGRRGLGSWAYPDTIIFDEIEYTDEHRSDLVYKDATGSVLDLNQLAGR